MEPWDWTALEVSRSAAEITNSRVVVRPHLHHLSTTSVVLVKRNCQCVGRSHCSGNSEGPPTQSDSTKFVCRERRFVSLLEVTVRDLTDLSCRSPRCVSQTPSMKKHYRVFLGALSTASLYHSQGDFRWETRIEETLYSAPPYILE